MTASFPETQHHGSKARSGSGPADRLWLVDFDHTLLAANSTELFIGSCSPSIIVAVIDFLVRRLLPWSRTGLAHWFRLRDYVCVTLILVLMPWTIAIWRRRAPGLFLKHQSTDVAAMLEGIDPKRLIIISFGNRFLIRALLRGSAYADCQIIATPWLAPPGWFKAGKAAIAEQAVGRDAVAAATVLTDSEDDRDLLEASADGRLLPPQGAPNLAREALYIPLRYSGSVKFTRSFAIDQWLLVDSCLYGLSVAHGLVSLLHFVLIAPLLSLSFMCVYEIGYFENDMHAALKETNPTLSGKEARYRHYPIRWQSWVWAAASALAALGLAVWLGELAPRALVPAAGLWLALLLVSRLVFRAYNAMAARNRLLAYPLLQLSKYGSILAIFPPAMLGCLIVIGQITTMWVNYVAYRLDGDTSRFPKESFRLILFALSAVVVLASGSLLSVSQGFLGEPFVLVAITGWLLLRVAKSALMRRLKPR